MSSVLNTICYVAPSYHVLPTRVRRSLRVVSIDQRSSIIVGTREERESQRALTSQSSDAVVLEQSARTRSERTGVRTT